MKKEFVTYEISLKLKELGFDEKCFGFYTINNPHYIDGTFHLHFSHPFTPEIEAIEQNTDYCILAPLWQQVIDWFREKHNIVVNVYANASGYLFEMHDSAKKGGTHRYDSGFDGPNESGCWDSYYEAREQAILKAIELCQKEK